MDSVTIIVDVGNERVRHEVYVDRQTGLDVDIDTGVFRSREETEALVRDVYSVGKSALGADLERYNRWLATGGAKKEEALFRPISKPTARAADSTRAAAHPRVEELSDAFVWKEQGNGHLIKGDHQRALQCYTAGLQQEPNNAVLLSNRAEVNLRLGRYNCALEDASAAIANAEASVGEKAWFRRIRARIGMRDRSGALGDLEVVHKMYPASRAASDWIIKSKEAAELPVLELAPLTHKEAPGPSVDVPRFGVISRVRHDVAMGTVVCVLPAILIRRESERSWLPEVVGHQSAERLRFLPIAVDRLADAGPVGDDFAALLLSQYPKILGPVLTFSDPATAPVAAGLYGAAVASGLHLTTSAAANVDKIARRLGGSTGSIVRRDEDQVFPTFEWLTFVLTLALLTPPRAAALQVTTGADTSELFLPQQRMFSSNVDRHFFSDRMRRAAADGTFECGTWSIVRLEPRADTLDVAVIADRDIEFGDVVTTSPGASDRLWVGAAL